MRNSEDERPVGYRSPPAHTRFKAGQSGNPNGRPKKAKTLKAELIDELAEFTNVSEDGQNLRISKARAIAKTIVRAAAAGNMRATTALLSLFARDQIDSEQPEEATSEERALIDEFLDREVRRRAAESSSEQSKKHEQKGE